MVERSLKIVGMEKIFLHLNKYNKFRNHIEVPSALTQEGIVKAIGTTQQNVSTIIKRLEDKGMVYKKRLHIQGRKKRKKAYFLTDEGIREAQAFKKGFEQAQYIDFADQAPQLRHFFGREEEIRGFKDWLESDTYKVFVISGIAGIGKTAYVSKAVDPYRESMHIFWYRFNEWSTLRSFLTRLGDFLSKTGSERLSANLQSKEKVDINEISIILTNELEDLNALLVFDDYQKVKDKEEIAHMFGALRQLLEQVTGTKVIIVGREVPRFFYDEREVKIKKTMKELNLGGLDKESSLKLLDVRGIIGKKRQWLYELTRGHPLSLELIHETEMLETQDEVKKFMRDEIFSLLTPEERKILEIASVFRFPIYSTAFIDILDHSQKDTSEEIPPTFMATTSEEIDHEVIDSLVNKSLLQESGGVCDVHDLIREFLYDRIPEHNRKKYHQKIAEYYLQKVAETAQTILEAQHHLLMAEEFKKAVELAVEKAKMLLQDGYWQEVQDIIERIPFESIELQHKPEMLLLRGSVYEIQGELEKALQDYMQSIELFKKIKRQIGASSAFRRIGDIKLKRNRWAESTKNYKKALTISQQIGEIDGVIESHRGIGIVLGRNGEFDMAIVELKKALECSMKVDNDHATGKVYIDMANIKNEVGEYDKAIKDYTKSIPLLTTIGDKYQIARANIGIGLAYSRKGELKKAIDWYERAIKLGEEIGNIQLLAYVTSNAAEVYVNIGDLEKALECCKKAEPIFEKIDEKHMIANTQMVYGMIYNKKKNWDLSERHFKKALDISIKVNVEDITAQIHHSYGRMLVEKGKQKEAKKQFEKAIYLWQKLGNKHRVDSLKKEMKK